MLTPIQRTTLLKLQQHFSKHGEMPTRRELSQEIYGTFNAGMVQRHLKGLEERGFIRTLKNKHRAIEIVRPIEPQTEYLKFDFETGKFTRLPDP